MYLLVISNVDTTFFTLDSIDCMLSTSDISQSKTVCLTEFFFIYLEADMGCKRQLDFEQGVEGKKSLKIRIPSFGLTHVTLKSFKQTSLGAHCYVNEMILVVLPAGHICVLLF